MAAPRPVQAVGAAVALALVLTGVLGMRALSGGGDAPRSERFTGVVTRLTGDGSMMCVRRDDAPGSPFCDLYYVRPGTPRIRLGDRVLATTIASRGADGEPVAGMLVAPLP